MADLMQGSSEYELGTLDTAAVLVNNVSPVNANQPNGLADAIIQMQHILGSGTDLRGTLADLATRIAVQMNASGILIPIGSMLLHGGALPPLFADAFGQEASRTGLYANLFAVYGTTYGVGNGTTTFNMPDFRGRIPMGLGIGAGGGATGTGAVTGGLALPNITLGGWGGEPSHLLSQGELPNYNLTVTDPGHAHPADGAIPKGVGATGPLPSYQSLADVDGSILSATTGISVNSAGGGNRHNVLNPYLGTRIIIKY